MFSEYSFRDMLNVLWFKTFKQSRLYGLGVCFAVGARYAYTRSRRASHCHSRGDARGDR